MSFLHTSLLSRVSSRGEEPDEYPDKQPVAWPARSISVQAQHPQPFFPSSQSASRFIPLWGNSSFFFFSSSSFLRSPFVVERGFQGEDTLPLSRWINLGDTEGGRGITSKLRARENQNCGIVYYIRGKNGFFLNRWLLFLALILRIF